MMQVMTSPPLAAGDQVINGFQRDAPPCRWAISTYGFAGRTTYRYLRGLTNRWTRSEPGWVRGGSNTHGSSLSVKTGARTREGTREPYGTVPRLLLPSTQIVSSIGARTTDETPTSLLTSHVRLEMWGPARFHACPTQSHRPGH